MHHRPCIQLFEKVKQWDDQLRVDPAYVRKVSPSTLSTRTVCPPPSPAPGPTDDMAVITLHAEAARGAYFLPLLIAILFLCAGSCIRTISCRPNGGRHNIGRGRRSGRHCRRDVADRHVKCRSSHWRTPICSNAGEGSPGFAPLLCSSIYRTYAGRAVLERDTCFASAVLLLLIPVLLSLEEGAYGCGCGVTRQRWVNGWS